MNCYEILHTAKRMNMKVSINYMIKARKKEGTMLQSLGYVLPCTTEQKQASEALLCKMNGHYSPQHNKTKPQL